MIDYTYNNLFMDDSTSKQLIIEFDNTVITNEDLFDQTMTLEESLCSEKELRFGACEASVLSFKVANIVTPMKSKWLSAKMVLNNHTNEPFIIGRYKVAEDKLTADKMWREITAYDAMYDIINADASKMAAWYNEVLPNADSTVTLRDFRTRFISYFGLEQVLPQDGLVNDGMIVEKTIEPEQISGKDIITAICEINGCFGHIGRDGKFYYIYLTQNIEGLYPRNDLFPSNNIFPKEPVTSPVGAKGSYISVDWKDFKTKTINKLQIRQAENDIGAVIGECGDNCYIIENNFLVYGKSSEELWRIGNNIFNKITKIIYRPLIEADVKGNPCFEVGDPIRIVTKHKLIETYILQRTLKGIQALRDSYKSEGVEKYSEQVNGVLKSIIQLKGKTNMITRTVEENRLEMLDIETGLSFTIVETAKGLQANIEAEQQRAEGEESKLSTQIELTAEGLKADITKETERAEGEEEKLSNSIKVTAEGLQANIDAETKRAGKAEEKLSTNLKVTAEGLQLNIDSEVKRAGEAEKELSSNIEATAEMLSSEIIEKTQVWDTGDYKIDFSGFGEPEISVEPGTYYLDTKTGVIYAGVRSNPREGWVHVADYTYNEDSDVYIREDYFQEGYGAPRILRKPLEQYGYVDPANPPLSENKGDVWISPSPSGLRVTYYTYDLAHPAEWRIVGYAELETLPEMSSRITQVANAIVLKVDAGGNIVEVGLTADPKDGSIFKVKADNIILTAEEVINLMSSGDLNLTGKNIKITSDNFKVDKNGNVTAKNAKFNDVECKNIKAFSIDSDSLDAMKEFSTAVNDSESMKLAQKAITNAQKAITDTNTTVKNLNSTIIPQINSWITQLSNQIKELGKPGIS